MNALVQRSGRCARFPNEQGTVHVYEFPGERGWLPYGTLSKAEASVDATRDLLNAAGQAMLDPNVVGQWVEIVHHAEDEQAVKSGVKERSNRLFEVIHQNAIQRDPAGIAHLIRGDDSESISVIVTEGRHLPEVPGKLESISMSRWSLAGYLSPPASIGSYWDGDETEPWKPLTDRSALADTYAVALPPEFASYDEEVGLRIGRAGRQESPARQDPPRPGYAIACVRPVSSSAKKPYYVCGFDARPPVPCRLVSPGIAPSISKLISRNRLIIRPSSGSLRRRSLAADARAGADAA